MTLPQHPDVVTDRPAAWVAWRTARGLLAAVALLVALGGVPWALLRWTRGPITGLPTWEQISDFPTTLVTQDSTIVAILTVGLWIAWAVFAICVVVEAAGEIGGTSMHRVPAAGPLQQLARSLVASVAMSFGSLGSLGQGAAGTLTAATAVTGTALVAETSTVDAAPPLPSDDEPTIRWQTISVEEGDTLWELAERHYGDGTKWLLLWEDNRREPQPDGRIWTDQSAPVEPGWQLRVRAAGHLDAATPEGPEQGVDTAEPPQAGIVPASPGPTDSEVTVRPGDNFWSLATDHLGPVLGHPPTESEVAPYWLRVVDANRDRLVRAGDPNLVYPGQTFVLPAVDIDHAVATADTPSTPSPPRPNVDEPPARPEGTPSASEATTTAPPGTGPDATPATGGPESPRPTAQPDTSDPAPNDRPAAADDGAPTAATVIGTLTAGAALAIGVIHTLRQRRRRRNHRHPSTAPRPSSNPQLHRELIAAADEDAHGQLQRALGHLGSVLADAGAESRPRIVQHAEDHVDALLDVPSEPATGGWTAQADGAVWSCDPAELDPSDQDGGQAATPLLVTLGRPDAGGQLYLDLEAEGLVALTGDPTAARDVARAMVVELAHSPLAGPTQLIVVGDLGGPAVDGLDRTTYVEEWASVTDSLQAWAEQSHDALVRDGWPNAFLARAAHADDDALIPLVVFADHAPSDPGTLSELQAIEPRSTAVVVVGEEVSAATVVECAPGRLSLPQLGLMCEPQLLGADQFDAIVELLDDAEDPAGEQLQLLPDDHSPSADPPGLGKSGDESPVTGNGGPYQDPPYDVLVRLLGDITIDGASKRLTPKQTAVLAYIALHRTVTAERAGDALWPEQATSWRRRLSNTVSACRSAIGGHHLPLAGESTYRAGPRLLTDTDLFTRRIAAAASQPRSQAVETLRGALDLVRGPVFHYPDKERNPYAWVSLEDWISVWERKITAVARQVADAYLSAGETDDAVDVAQRIHAMVPTDTELTELLMRCYAASGDRIAVRRVYHAHIDALAALDLDDPADSTAALYDELRSATSGLTPPPLWPVTHDPLKWPLTRASDASKLYHLNPKIAYSAGTASCPTGRRWTRHRCWRRLLRFFVKGTTHACRQPAPRSPADRDATLRYAFPLRDLTRTDAGAGRRRRRRRAPVRGHAARPAACRGTGDGSCRT